MYMIRTIHPVGHSGFYTEIFYEGENRIGRVVYDCGAKNLKRLIDVIDRTFEKNEIIDAIFISHLDNDHITGLPHLAKRCKICRIFFPIIDSESAKYLSIFNTISYPGDPGIGPARFYEQFPIDPKEAFRVLELSRDRIPIFYGVNEEETDIDIPAEPEEEQRGTPQTLGEIKAKGGRNADRPYSDIEEHNERDSIIVINSGAVLGKSWFECENDAWKYIPFNIHNKQALKDLKSKLKSLFGRTLTSREMAGIVTDISRKTDLKLLKKAYKSVVGGINTNSMTVCSVDDHDYVQFRIYPHEALACRTEGALYLGDYDAKKNCNFAFLENAYAKEWGNIGCLQIPHHGSDRNFNKNLVTADRYYFVSVGDAKKKGTKHPGTIVRKAIKNKDLYIVDKDDNTKLSLKVCPIDQVILLRSRGVAMIFDAMLEEERIKGRVMDCSTARIIFEYLCEENTVRRMISAVMACRPPFEAVVEDIECICNLPNSDLDIRRGAEHWKYIHRSLGKMVAYILSDRGIKPEIRNPKPESNSNRRTYIRRKLRKGTQFIMATKFIPPMGEN